jgi:hypothetical protein
MSVETVAAEQRATPAPHGHLVAFYRDEDELATTVGNYLLGALRDGGTAVVIATQAHREAFGAYLAGEGIDVDAAAANGSLRCFDVPANRRCGGENRRRRRDYRPTRAEDGRHVHLRPRAEARQRPFA